MFENRPKWKTGKEQFTFNYTDFNPNSGGKMGQRNTDNMVCSKEKTTRWQNFPGVVQFVGEHHQQEGLEGEAVLEGGKQQ